MCVFVFVCVCFCVCVLCVCARVRGLFQDTSWFQLVFTLSSNSSEFLKQKLVALHYKKKCFEPSVSLLQYMQARILHSR